MIITISGFHGTGKTTVGKKLAEKLNLNYYSTGKAFRELADEYDMILENFSKYVEEHPQIDRKLDNKIIEIAQEKDDIIIDSLLSGYLLRDTADYKILLRAPLNVRVERMVDRDDTTIDQKLKETKIREESEIQRFKDLYEIDLMDNELRDEVFDLIIDTKELSIEEVVEKIIKHLEYEKII